MHKLLLDFGKRNNISFQIKTTPTGLSKIRTTSSKLARNKSIMVDYEDELYETQILERIQLIEANITSKKLSTKKKKEKIKKDLGKGIEKKVTVKEVDDIFSQYIRLKYGDVCYTCGKKGKVGCGHYQSRKIWELRRDIRNCKCQCFRICNAKFSGNGMPTEFRANLKAEGVDVDELDRIAISAKQGKSKKPNSVELREIYDFWKRKYEDLKISSPK